MSTRTQGTIRDAEVLRHSPMVRDFVLTFVKVVIEYQVSFIDWKYFKTTNQAVVPVTRNTNHFRLFRDSVSRDLFAPPCLMSHVARDGVKIGYWLAYIRTDQVGNLHRNSVNRYVSKIFRIVKTI